MSHVQVVPPEPMSYKDKKKQNAFQNTWLQKRRLEWIDSQGGKCVKCGSVERLEVDHIERAGKTTHRIWSFSEKRRKEELKKCQVLCYYCHKQKTISEFKKPLVHGTNNGYNKHKCKCFECMEWMRQNSRRKRELKKKTIRDGVTGNTTDFESVILRSNRSLGTK